MSTQTFHASSCGLHCYTDTTGGLLLIKHYTTEPAATVLATQTRDASVSGPTLREVHHRVDVYLAYKLLNVVRAVIT
jgi:hypothetical protein